MWNLLAQSSEEAAAGGIMAVMGGMMLLYWAYAIAMYVGWALALSKKASAMGLQNSWFAWVPILNIVLLIQIVELETWWIIVCLLCGIATIYPLMKFAEKCGKESWWGILAIVPCIGIIVPFMLMKSEAST